MVIRATTKAGGTLSILEDSSRNITKDKRRSLYTRKRSTIKTVYAPNKRALKYEIQNLIEFKRQ